MGLGGIMKSENICEILKRKTTQLVNRTDMYIRDGRGRKNVLLKLYYGLES